MSRELLARLALAVGLIGLGFAGGHAWSACRYEAVQIRQLTRLAREDLAAALTAEAYAQVPAILDRHAATRQVASLAWTDPRGEPRAVRGTPPSPLVPPTGAGADAAAPQGEARGVAWVPLPPAPEASRPDWLRLELLSLAPGAGWVGPCLLLCLLGWFGLPGREPPPGLLGDPEAADGTQEEETCSEGGSSPAG